MKKAGIVLLLLAVVGVAVAWSRYQQTPRVEFVEFRDTSEGRAAVFHIRNESDAVYSYPGYEEGRPLYYFGTPKGGGWDDCPTWSCALGVSYHELRPRSQQEVLVSGDSHVPKGPFRIGVHFIRGTKAQVESAPDRPVLQWIRYLHYLMTKSEVELGTSWSRAVPAAP